VGPDRCRCHSVEDAFLDWLLSRIPSDPRLEVPPGDDAAVLRPAAMRRPLLAADMLVEGVHFEPLPGVDPALVGHKALAVNLSDIAAMGGRGEAAVATVALPRRGGGQIGRAMLEGMLELAAAENVVLAGGDTTSWDGPLTVSVTVLGSVGPHAAWRRDAARPGDRILATGRFGGSLLGRHLSFRPRCREALAIVAAIPGERVAAIDVSDGLSLDLARMMRASGTGAVVEVAAVPIHPDAQRAAEDGRSPLEHALTDGEDFELLLAVAPAVASRLLALAAAGGDAWPGTPLTVIGEVVAEPGLVAVDAAGSRRPLVPRGFLHELDA